MKEYVKSKNGQPPEVVLSSLRENSSLVDIFDRISTALQALDHGYRNSEDYPIITYLNKAINSSFWEFKESNQSKPLSFGELVSDLSKNLILSEENEEEIDDFGSFVQITEIRATS